MHHAGIVHGWRLELISLVVHILIDFKHFKNRKCEGLLFFAFEKLENLLLGPNLVGEFQRQHDEGDLAFR